MRLKRHKKHWWIALCAVFLFQSVAMVSASDAMSGTPTRDVFGNPLCISSQKTGTPDTDAGHSRISDCCSLGCYQTPVGTTPPPPRSDVIVLHPPVSPPVRVVRTVVWFPQQDHHPGFPRAPPSTP